MYKKRCINQFFYNYKDRLFAVCNF